MLIKLAFDPLTSAGFGGLQMMKLWLRGLLFLVVAPVITYGQDTTVHPIDKAFEQCTEKDPSTAGMVRCTDIAYRKWDQELNKNYLELMRKLKVADKQTLKAAQLAWIKYRDAEFKSVDSVYAMLQGTMYIPMHEARRMEIIKERAQSLATYLDLIKEESEP
jgi:uncharacterized protein YecT (DUF1311 family)